MGTMNTKAVMTVTKQIHSWLHSEDYWNMAANQNYPGAFSMTLREALGRLKGSIHSIFDLFENRPKNNS
jgi:hypothetical protein